MDALLAEVRRRWGDPAANVCDRWREQELRQALEAISFPVFPLIVHGQGYRDGGQDVREFRKACIDERVRPARSLLMRSAMSGARVQTDPAGNAKLAKGGDPCCCGGAAALKDAAQARIAALDDEERQRQRDSQPLEVRLMMTPSN